MLLLIYGDRRRVEVALSSINNTEILIYQTEDGETKINYIMDMTKSFFRWRNRLHKCLRYLFHRLHKKQPVKAAVVIISIYIVTECQADPLERFVEPVRSLRYSPPR